MRRLMIRQPSWLASLAGYYRSSFLERIIRSKSSHIGQSHFLPEIDVKCLISISLSNSSLSKVFDTRLSREVLESNG
jgi:hypothetical protein